LVLAIRWVLLVWKTTLLLVLFRDAGLLSAETTLEGAKIRFAIRLQTVDNKYPLVRRINLRLIIKGRNTSITRRKTKIYILRTFLLEVLCLRLRTLYFSTDYKTNPTRKIDKETVVIVFKE
jgi:hypothetical protein